MSHPDPFARDQHSDHVETVDLAWSAMTVYPNACRAGQFALLTPVDCFDRITEVRPTVTRAPGLDLDEGHQSAPFDDEVDIAMTGAKSALKDTPACPL